MAATGRLDADWFEALAAASLDALFVLEPIRETSGFDVRCRYANDAAGRLFGLPAEDLIDRRLVEAIRPIHGQFRRDLADAWLSGEPRRHEIETLPENIAATRVEYQIVPVGEMLAVSVADRSTERAAQAAAERSDALLQAGSSSSFAGCAVLVPQRDETGAITNIMIDAANEEIARLLRRPLDDLVGQPWYGPSFVGRRRLLELVQQTDTEPGVIESVFDLSTLEEIPADAVHARVVRVGSRVVAHLSDITNARRLTQQLVASEELYRSVFESTTEGIVLIDPGGTIRFANEAFRRIMRCAEPEGRFILDFADPADDEGRNASIERITSGRPAIARRRAHNRRADGTRVWTDVIADAVRDAAGEVLWYIAFVADVDDAVRSELVIEQLRGALDDSERSERTRLAEELHDGPVQWLAAASLQLGGALGHPGGGVDDDLLHRVEQLLLTTSDELRSLMYRLTPPELDADAPGESVRSRVAALLDGSGIAWSVADDITGPLPGPLLALLVRVVQEAVINARKHAAARHVDVRLFEDGTRVVVEVADDGIGYDGDPFAGRLGHLGLRALRERVGQVGGVLTFVSRDGGGSTVHAELDRIPVDRSVV